MPAAHAWRRALGAVLLLSADAALAQGWITATSGASAPAMEAGYASGGALDGLWFSCAGANPGMVSLVFARAAPGLPADVDHTLVLSVDGTAYVRSARIGEAAGRGQTVLVSTASLAETMPLIEALKTGKSVEIAAPDGRTTLPLTGSGKALAGFVAACGG